MGAGTGGGGFWCYGDGLAIPCLLYSVVHFLACFEVCPCLLLQGGGRHRKSLISTTGGKIRSGQGAVQNSMHSSCWLQLRRLLHWYLLRTCGAANPGVVVIALARRERATYSLRFETEISHILHTLFAGSSCGRHHLPPPPHRRGRKLRGKHLPDKRTLSDPGFEAGGGGG